MDPIQLKYKKESMPLDPNVTDIKKESIFPARKQRCRITETVQ